MPTGQLTILLVEDQPADARLVQLALAESVDPHYTVHQVEYLHQALDRLAGRHFDAILLDLSLPDSQGLDTVTQIKTAAGSTPVIVLSGLHDEATAIRAVQSGAQDYLVKGQEQGLVSRAIRYAIERQTAEDALRRAHDELEQRVADRTAELLTLNQQLSAEIAERKASEAAQQKSEHQLHLITDALPVLISYIDTELRYQFNNRAYEDWFGIPLDQLRGHSVRETVGERAFEQVYPYFQKALQGQRINYEMATPFQHGGERYVSATYIPDFGASGELRGLFTVVTDITELKQAEEQQRRHLLELAHVSRLSTMGEMATEIAHEVNQPLAAIASYGDTCQRMVNSGKYDPADLVEALQEITAQAERAGEVIRQLRNFVRKDESQRALIDINELVKEVTHLIDVEARWHRVSIKLKLGTDLPVVPANKILIQQVLLNLVHNAIEALADSPADDRHIIITTAIDENRITVSVRDSGPGLPEHQLQQVFDAFHTTKVNGMGMGLSISSSIIKAHQGRIRCENNPDKGCNFSFSLPVTPTDSNPGDTRDSH